MKRPIAKGDFRSNVSQGSDPVPHKLTGLEKEESLAAAKAVGGIVVGVDFIPAKNREKDKPYFIEVNSTPGLIGIEECLKSEGSVTKKILTKLQDRSLWANA
jgi:glutathione synthase/RimK-type ligase-like ATP-grasp enzyme